MNNSWRPETLAVHQNYRGEEENAIVRPIHPTTAYYFGDADHGADLFNLAAAGNIYTRLTNPTNDALGTVVSDLEGGVGGLAFASGAAALAAVVTGLCQAGDHIVASKELYGGSKSLFTNIFAKFGITTTFVDQNASFEELSEAFCPQTRFLFAEIISNPRASVLNCAKFEKLAQTHDVPLVIDATFTPPNLFRSIDHGANLVIHSATKYLGGHGNAMGGVLVDAGTYDWNNGKFPGLTEPDPSYHGLVYTKAFGNQAFILKARAQVLRDTGATLSPWNAFIIGMGLQTLHVRLDYISRNALALAQWLENHPLVEWVGYPLLPSHPQFDLAKTYFPNGAGGILSFGVKGDLEKGKAFINSLKLGIQAVNVGDVRTIVTHPASTTHRQVSPEDLIAQGITENFIRVSVGLEHLEDIKADLDQALRGQNECR